MTFKKVVKTHIYEIVVEQIKAEIDAGSLAPGTRLPSERDLAEQFGVSRPSIREAMRVLEVMGYVEIKTGQGMFVCEVDPNEERTKVLLSMLDQDENVVQLLEVREIFEPQIVYLAAQSATERDIQVLEDILARMDRHTKAGKSTVSDNIDFHLAIARSVDNQVLFQVQKLLLKASKDAVVRYFQVPGRESKSLIGHREILDAIIAHDPEKARTLMFQHLRTRFAVPNGHVDDDEIEDL